MRVFIRLMDKREIASPVIIPFHKFSPRENRIHLVRRFDIY